MMRYIKLFIASSVIRFEDELNQLGDTIRVLNDLYVRRGLYFRLVLVNDLAADVEAERLHESRNAQIAESQFFYVLFGGQAEQQTIARLEHALQCMHTADQPRIYVFFQQTEGRQAADVAAFMQRVDREMQHYYSVFDSIDAIRLNLLLELARSQGADAQLTFAHGQAQLNGRGVMSLEHVPIWKRHEHLHKLRQEQEELNRQFADLTAALAAMPENATIYHMRIQADKQRSEINKQIEQIETSILDLCLTISKQNSSGQPLTERQKKASQFFDQGDLQAALAILNDAQREVELEQAKRGMQAAQQLMQTARAQMAAYINEGRLKIKTLKAMGVTRETLPQIDACYEECAQVAHEYQVELAFLNEYIDFLDQQHQYERMGKWAERFLEDCTRTKAEDALLLDAYYQLAGYQYRQQDYQTAESTLRRCIDRCRAHDEQDSEKTDRRLSKYANLLGMILAEQDNYDAAETVYREALAIRTRLAARDPEAYEPELTRTYNNLANLLDHLTRYEEAESMYHQALAIRKRLAARDPEAYEPDLASIYNNLANLLDDLKRYEEAENMYREALAIRTRLAERNPDAYEPNLAGTYTNLAGLLDDLERYEEAESMHRKALAICVRLAERNPESHEPGLANTYNNLANLLDDMKHYEEAESMHRKALMIRTRLAERNPDVYEADVGGTYNNLAVLLEHLKRNEEAESMCRKALMIRARLAKRNPEVYEADLAGTYHNLATMLDDQKRCEEADTMYREAIAIRRRLAERNPEAYEPQLAQTCRHYAVMLNDLNRCEEAVDMYREALMINKRLVERNREAYEPVLAGSYCRLAVVLIKLRRYEEAESLYREALAINRRCAEREPEAYEMQTANTLFGYALLRLITGCSDEGRAMLQEARALYAKHGSPAVHDVEELLAEMP